MRNIVKRPFAGTTVVPDGPLDTDDGGALRQAALNGAGIARLMRFAVADDFLIERIGTLKV